MTVQIGINNALTYSFSASAKTLTVTGLELGNLTSIRNVTRGNAEMKSFITGISVSGSAYTLTLSEVPESSADSDELVLLMEQLTAFFAMETLSNGARCKEFDLTRSHVPIHLRQNTGQFTGQLRVTFEISNAL